MYWLTVTPGNILKINYFSEVIILDGLEDEVGGWVVADGQILILVLGLYQGKMDNHEVRVDN